MSIFGGDSESNVTQNTVTTNINAQGIAAPTVIGEGNRLTVTDQGAVRRAMDAIVKSTRESTRGNERIAGASINAGAQALNRSLAFGRNALAFADDQAARATRVTLAALDEIGTQNARTIDTVAAASASTVREIANATRSEAAQLSEKVITYGTVAAVVVAIAWMFTK